jgi:hypothetical protein
MEPKAICIYKNFLRNNKMFKIIKLKYLTLILVSLVSSGCNIGKPHIKPYFNSNNHSHAFFDKLLVVESANDFLILQDKAWKYSTDLEHKKKGQITVSNCLALNSSLSEGYLAVNAYDHPFVNAKSVICSMWALMGEFNSYNVSFMDQLTLNKDFAKQAPAQFALLISDEQIEKALSAASWHEVSKIKEVQPTSTEEATFYDSTGGIQRLTLMAKGDYNADGIEDRLYYMENNVEGVSYASAQAYIITRLTADGPIKLLKEI